jgi:hypothetical protein
MISRRGAETQKREEEQMDSHRATEPQREKKKGFSVAFSALCGSV